MKMVDTLSMAASEIKTIGASLSQNIHNTFSRKECQKGGSDMPFHDEGDDDIASH